jgi:hypothetical protein
MGAEAEDPADIAALEELADKLSAIAGSEENAKRVAAALGQPVGPNHRALLEALLEGVQLAAANERAMDYSDAPDGEQQNRASFAAHFTSLMPALDTWHVAVERLEAAAQSLRDWVPQEVIRRGSSSLITSTERLRSASEITVGRARRWARRRRGAARRVCRCAGRPREPPRAPHASLSCQAGPSAGAIVPRAHSPWRVWQAGPTARPRSTRRYPTTPTAYSADQGAGGSRRRLAAPRRVIALATLG